MLKLAKVPKEFEKTIEWSDYFKDPDGISVLIDVSEEETSDAVTMTKDETSMHFIGTGKGTAVYQITAKDASDPTIVHDITIKVNSCDAKALVWKMIRIPVIIAAIILVLLLGILIYAVTGKKIYGKWDIIASEKTLKKRRLFMGAGKKSKCSMNRLLKELGIQGDFPGVEFVAGNRLGKKVTIRGFEKINEVAVNGNRVTDPARLKKLKVCVSAGKSITLTSSAGVKVRFERKER